MTDLYKEADNIAQHAEQGLQNIDPGPFSNEAFVLLTGKISDFVRSLIIESSKTSKRYGADTISASHVEHASTYLAAHSRRRWQRHFGTIGGILLGASLSNILSMTTTDSYTAVAVIISVVLVVVGAFGVALHIGND